MKIKWYTREAKRFWQAVDENGQIRAEVYANQADRGTCRWMVFTSNRVGGAWVSLKGIKAAVEQALSAADTATITLHSGYANVSEVEKIAQSTLTATSRKA